MDVRPETPTDTPAIHAVHAAAFPSEDEANLVDALRAAGRLTLSLVAEEEGRVVGHVGFSPVRVADGDDTDGLGLAPVAVLPDHRRRGIADRLVRRGLALAAGLGRGFVVVLGDPAYYGRFGFQPASDWRLTDEYGGAASFQAQELRRGAIPAGGGLVRYAPEFAAFS
jgi:putative acetyltransferase